MRRLLTSPLFRSVFAVASGTAAAQAVAFAFSPLITRIYGPEAFGLQAVFLSLISILGPAISLRYPMAIIVADDETDAQYLGRLSLMIAFVLSCLVGLALWIARGAILALLGAEALGSLIWFLPLALFFTACQDVSEYRTARLNNFRVFGVVTVVQACLTNLARVLGGLAAPVAGILVAVTSIAPSVQVALLSFGIRSRRIAKPPLGLHRARGLLRKHRDFPIYRVPTDVLNAASQSVPVILLTTLFSPVAAGLYSLTRSVLGLPLHLIGMSTGNVLYARFAELDRDGKALTPLLLKTTAHLLIVFPIIALIAWFAPPAFALMFGEEWREAGYYAQWMSLWVGFSISNIPSIRLAPVIKAQNLLLIMNIAILVIRVLAMVGTYWSGGGEMAAIAAFSLVSLFANAGLILAIIIVAQHHDTAAGRLKPASVK
ncbi:oligosaccharide flippase family protein [Croceibacterium sp. LX-88]|uniref:Oligosaccharide flippase family protein n=1 Tax=Croceibacterium selenioxidans TaxID=2838833 RepID=A0ABS5W2J7_9SPHN|nr:oligosaccharide flippase family protein [Croceibacterium selenioxidans]MBT2133567.1 oligosaccharide flippase family protein [Croceibacterium selenioxidans]